MGQSRRSTAGGVVVVSSTMRPSIRERLLRGNSRASASRGQPAASAGVGTSWHVISEHGAAVRQTKDAASTVITTLVRGTVLTADERHEKTLHVIQPVEGWLDEVSPGDNAVVVCPGDATTSARWRYRVVCGDGAYVRSGLELSSPHIYTVSHQAIMEVHERRVNEQGLARLRTDDGWISEHLNPLSGQRGPIVELLPVVSSLKYRVVLQEGAVVRETVELSSPIVRVIQVGEVMSVCDKQFSNHPSSRCVPRLKLGDGSGWISQRLNREPPDDLLVVELIGAMPLVEDPPSQDGQQAPSALQPPQPAGGAVGSAKDDDSVAIEVEAVAAAIMSVRNRGAGGTSSMDTQCVICLSAGRNATIVHGETGHIACCLECARVLKARGDACPVCRMEIDQVIQHFWA